MKDSFHFGKSESIISILLLLMVIVGLFIFKARPASGNAPVAEAVQTSADEPGRKEEKKDYVRPYSSSKQSRKKSRDSIVTDADYVGPPVREAYARSADKFPRGTVIDLNAADSATLTRIPGIGPTFARRIVSYRRQLGGYYTVLQLQEVYDMDYERFCTLRPWFKIGIKPDRIDLKGVVGDSILRHPYINYKQRAEIKRLLRSSQWQGSWVQLLKLPTFTKEDSIRLSPYFDIH